MTLTLLSEYTNRLVSSLCPSKKEEIMEGFIEGEVLLHTHPRPTIRRWGPVSK